MPRIRTIKPEIWNSRDFMALSEVGQLAFFALIGHADDEGRLEADAEHLHLIALRRSSPDTIEQQLTLMDDRRMIQRYEAGGRPIVQIVNWGSHQKVDHPKASTLPAPPVPNPLPPPRRLAKRREPSRSVETPRDASRHDATVPEESRDDANTREPSRAFDPSRAPADRTGPDLTGSRTGPDQRARVREDLPEAVSPAVARRVNALQHECEKLLHRPLRSDERPVLIGWAGMERAGELVSLAEVLDLVEHLLSTPTRDSTLPGTLRYCDATVLTLARAPWRGPAAHPPSLADVADALEAADGGLQVLEGGQT